MNIKEDYVSFETAKLLKEKGFPLPSTNFEDWAFCMYDENGDIQWGCYHPDYYARVTLQMAMKWLREVHNWNIFTNKSNTVYGYDANIESLVANHIVEVGCEKTYEKAVETAIKYCLKNLI